MVRAKVPIGSPEVLNPACMYNPVMDINQFMHHEGMHEKCLDIQTQAAAYFPVIYLSASN